MAAAVTAATLLAGCGTTSGTAEPAEAAKPTKTASKRPVEAEPADQVLDDMRFAMKAVAGRHESLVVPIEAMKLKGFHPCRVNGTTFTPAEPTLADIRLIADRLKQRGWKVDRGTVDKEFNSLTHGAWELTVGSGAIPEDAPPEVGEDAGEDKGGIVFSAAEKCRKIE